MSWRTWVIGAVGLLLAVGSARGETWAERLGYPAGKRVVLLHADDVGMCYEANAATARYLEEGTVRSAAAMVPCPWFGQVALWAKEHPGHDLGLHLTLTSEWKHYRWGPVAPHEEVRGLIDPEGYLWRSVRDVAIHASPTEVKRELRAQVERALALGFRPTHLDTHMGTLFARPDFTLAYLQIAVEYGIPAMVIEFREDLVDRFRARGYPVDDLMIEVCADYPLPKLDDFQSVEGAESYDEMVEKTIAQIRSFEPGITELVFHPSDDSEALRHILNRWQQRVWEARLFRDPRMQAFFEEEGIVITDWKEMMRRFEERGGKEAFAKRRAAAKAAAEAAAKASPKAEGSF